MSNFILHDILLYFNCNFDYRNEQLSLLVDGNVLSMVIVNIIIIFSWYIYLINYNL